MSLAQPPPLDRRPSPGLNLNLASNNPFRNRAVSPVSATLPSPPSPGLHINTDRPASMNPFLDATEIQPPAPLSGVAMPSTNGRVSPTKPTLTGSAAELFENLTIGDNSSTSQNFKQSPPRSRPENVPPRPMGRGPPPVRGPPPPYHPGRAHRPRRSREEEGRLRAAGKPTGPLDIFADPPSPSKRGVGASSRSRRNSDSSVVDRNSKHLDPESERRRQERKHRESKHHDGRRHGTSKSRKPTRKLDLIDQLDVTSIYGTGLFHHDGPFDACNPHRNRKGQRTAPMQAFPKDSMNNTIGGSGPVNSGLNLAQFHGRGAEGYQDYGNSAGQVQEYRAVRPTHGERSMSSGFNPNTRVEPLHGEESMGLGTSTFLEGAPASRTAIQRRESEAEAQMLQGGVAGGLQRKKSLAQKIRGMSNSRPSGRTTSPENILERNISPTSPMSAGGTATKNERNPFFQDNYDAAYDQKGAKIAAAEEQVGRARAPSSPRRGLGLERRITNDGSIHEGNDEEVNGSVRTGGGFLNRVKSLKGGRRTRPERKETAP